MAAGGFTHGLAQAQLSLPSPRCQRLQIPHIQQQSVLTTITPNPGPGSSRGNQGPDGNCFGSGGQQRGKEARGGLWEKQVCHQGLPSNPRPSRQRLEEALGLRLIMKDSCGLAKWTPWPLLTWRP